MVVGIETSATDIHPDSVTGKLVILSVVCAFAVANIYYAQPLLPMIAAEFGVTVATGGLISTLTQAGYALGFALWLPLADRWPRHRLILMLLIGNIASAIACALAPSIGFLLVATACTGLTAVTGQVVLPLAASLVPDERRGHAVGLLLGGFSIGVVSARTISGLIGALLGWRAMFWTAGILNVAVIAALMVILPRTPPTTRLPYAALLRSVGTLFLSSPRLRLLALASGLMFGAFTGFWAGLPFLLSRAPYGYGPATIGAFGVAAIPGVFLASVIGRWADKAGVRLVALTGAAIAALLSIAFALIGPLGSWLGIVLIAMGLDLANKCVLISGQSRIFAIDAAAIGRINTIFMSIFFLCGAIGSTLAAWLTGRFGWPGLAAACLSLALASLCISARGKAGVD